MGKEPGLGTSGDGEPRSGRVGRVVMIVLLACGVPAAVLVIASPKTIESWEALKLAYAFAAAIALACLCSLLGAFVMATGSKGKVESRVADGIAALVGLFLLNLVVLVGVLFLLRWIYGGA